MLSRSDVSLRNRPRRQFMPRRRSLTASLITTLSLFGVLLVAGCTPTRSPTPEYHLLTALAEGPTSRSLNTTIGVGPVRIAPFLETNQLVVHEGSGTLRSSGKHRWSEPLDQAVQRIMVQNLATLTSAKLRNFPWRQRAAPRFAIRLDVLDLDRGINGTAVLDVIWHLEDLGSERLVRSKRERFSLPVSSEGYGPLPSAYSELFNQLALRLITAIETELATAAEA